MLSLSVVAADGTERCRFEGSREVTLSWRGVYEPGDCIVVTSTVPGARLAMKLDAALPESFVTLAGNRFVFPVPIGLGCKDYPRSIAFAGERHWCYARVQDERERASWRNLARNAYDLQVAGNEVPQLYPHASTNVACDNPQFFAKNAIDGVFETCNHGSWPHESWGVGGRDDAMLRIDFGESVCVDELRVYLRADYPHDTWWRRARVSFSAGEPLVIDLAKTGEAQCFDVGGRICEWLAIEPFGKVDSAGFPAISQVMAMGTPVVIG